MKSLLLCLLLCFAFILPEAKAQTLPEPRQSPVGLTRLIVDDCYVKIVYGRPYVRDREIFGALVPFGEVWRTGANEATELTTTDDIYIGGELLKAGTYSIFTIPGKDEWTIIFSNQLGQWGSYTYDSANDELRLTAPVSETDSLVEIFTILLEPNDTKGKLTIEWERTKVVLPVEM